MQPKFTMQRIRSRHKPFFLQIITCRNKQKELTESRGLGVPSETQNETNLVVLCCILERVPPMTSISAEWTVSRNAVFLRPLQMIQLGAMVLPKLTSELMHDSWVHSWPAQTIYPTFEASQGPDLHSQEPFEVGENRCELKRSFLFFWGLGLLAGARNLKSLPTFPPDHIYCVVSILCCVTTFVGNSVLSFTTSDLNYFKIIIICCTL